MGCDIHVHFEYKRCINDVSRWYCGDYFSPNPWKDVYPDESPWLLVGFCDDRDYELFATLANVRNYGGTPFIAEPRGLPKDVTDLVKHDSDAWDGDGHSHSWVTLREMIDFSAAHKKVKRRGMVSLSDQKKLDSGEGFPSDWCQGTNMKDYAWREWEEGRNVLEPMIKAVKQRCDELFVIYEYLWEADPEAALERAKDVRIVFWFDN